MTRIFFLLLPLITAFTFAAENNAPYLYIIGVAQDAGYPQAGCYSPHCLPGWQDDSLKRSATSIALIDPVSSRSIYSRPLPISLTNCTI